MFNLTKPRKWYGLLIPKPPWNRSEQNKCSFTAHKLEIFLTVRDLRPTKNSEDLYPNGAHSFWWGPSYFFVFFMFSVVPVFFFILFLHSSDFLSNHGSFDYVRRQTVFKALIWRALYFCIKLEFNISLFLISSKRNLNSESNLIRFPVLRSLFNRYFLYSEIEVNILYLHYSILNQLNNSTIILFTGFSNH